MMLSILHTSYLIEDGGWIWNDCNHSVDWRWFTENNSLNILLKCKRDNMTTRHICIPSSCASTTILFHLLHNETDTERTEDVIYPELSLSTSLNLFLVYTACTVSCFGKLCYLYRLIDSCRNRMDRTYFLSSIHVPPHNFVERGILKEHSNTERHE